VSSHTATSKSIEFAQVNIRAQRSWLWLSPEGIQFLGIPMALGVMEYWSDGVLEKTPDHELRH